MRACSSKNPSASSTKCEPCAIRRRREMAHGTLCGCAPPFWALWYYVMVYLNEEVHRTFCDRVSGSLIRRGGSRLTALE